MTTDSAVTDARKLLHSIVERWDRQRHSSVLKDRADELLNLLDGVPPGSGTTAHYAGIRARSQPLRDAVATADARGYGGSLLAACRSLLRAIDDTAAPHE